MSELILYELKRTGEFSILPGLYDQMRVFSGTPFVTGICCDGVFEIPVILNGDANCRLIFSFGLSDSGVVTYPIINKSKQKTGLTITFNVVRNYLYKEILSDQIGYSFTKRFYVGHRGYGENKVSTEFLENTVDCMTESYKQGCRTVEFDIQMSKDGHPIVFHDFNIVSDKEIEGVAPYRVLPNGMFEYYPIQFTLDQFKKLELNNKWKSPMPSFRDLFESLPDDLGFDIEVKYPSEDLIPFRDVPYPERNEFIDAILAIMKDYSRNRPIFFSSFDPHIVAMLKLKQKRWPVLQLLCAEEWETKEQGINKILSLIPMHKYLGVDGFVLDAELLFFDESVMSQILNQGFILCTYGKPNNTENGVVKQYNMGVNGIVTDMIKMLQKLV